ncbi:MAG: radical SAM protein [Anaerolineales bacterium]|nr:radical SAM protein [Anaerolineales bacterium]
MRLPFPSRFSRKNSGLKPGLYGYTKHSADGRAQIHLRVHQDGGLLLINANRAFHLNPTATFMAWLYLEGLTDEEAIGKIRQRYRVDAHLARTDFAGVQVMVDQLIDPEGSCPVCELELDLLPPFSETPTAPYRMDLALTYRCNANCSHCYNARSRNYPEIGTKAWQHIIDRLWEIGVPHVCFTGGESTLRDDLPDLINHAHSKGQIVGLLTNGRRLEDEVFIQSLVEAGLDHVQITIESSEPTIHDAMVRAEGAWQQTVYGIQNALGAGLYVMTNTTLLAENAAGIGETIDFLADIGIPTIGCNALIYSGRGEQVGTGIPEAGLIPLLEIAREKTKQHGQRLIWYTPTQYCHFDPVQMELGVKACTAAMYNMCIEPDGGVIPCQSYYEQLGNLCDDTWESIWNHELAIWLRERRYIPEACQPCAMLKECGGGCPLTLLNQPQQAPLQFTGLSETLTRPSE